MKKIKISNSYSTGLDVFFDKDITTICLEEDHFGEGGFGQVYRVEKIDKQASPLPLVVKILQRNIEKNFETVVRLQRLVRQEAKNLHEQNILFFDKYPSLIALPLFSFEGKMDDETVYGYLSINLAKLGFVSSDYIFMKCLKEDPETWGAFQRRNLSVKYKMAYYLATSCAFLRRIHFIHADITPDNLFIHKYEPLCVIIDYDSGAIIDSKEDFPTTEGKFYADWTPPEMVADNSEKRLTAAVDDWAINIAFHYILTGYPAFFTKNMYPKTIRLFNEMYRDGSTIWPDINKDPKYADLFDAKRLNDIPQYRNYYDQLAESVKRGFEYSFSRGASRLALRHDANWWVAVLENCVQSYPFKVNVSWRSLKECKQEFPDLQSTRNAEVPKAWTNKMHFSKDHVSLQQADAKHQPPTPKPKKDKPKQPKEDKQQIASYMRMLLPDLISGKEKLSMHKPYIISIAAKNHLDGQQFVKDLEEFIKLFNDSIKDKVISRLEYSNLMCQANLLKIEQKTLDDLLKPYKRQ